MTVLITFQENTVTSKLEQATHELTIYSMATPSTTPIYLVLLVEQLLNTVLLTVLESSFTQVIQQEECCPVPVPQLLAGEDLNPELQYRSRPHSIWLVTSKNVSLPN